MTVSRLERDLASERRDRSHVAERDGEMKEKILALERSLEERNLELCKLQSLLTATKQEGELNLKATVGAVNAYNHFLVTECFFVILSNIYKLLHDEIYDQKRII